MGNQEERAEFTQGISIIVNENPMVFWDDDHPRNQLRILREIDSGYFRYLSQVHGSNLSGPSSAHAGVALRIAYSHAAETLFALVCSALQAPHYPIGWLLKYRYDDIKKLLSKIREHKPFENLVGVETGGWPEVVNALLPWGAPDIDFDELRRATVTLWKSVAHDVLDEALDEEYMSLKHGLRVMSGPWHFALGPESAPGIPAPRENMYVLTSSQFGSSYYRPSQLKKYNWMLAEPRVNWNPELLSNKIMLIANSIDHIVTFLRFHAGDDNSDMGFYYFNNDQVEKALEDPHERHTAFRITRNPGIQVERISPYYNHRSEIFDTYQKMKEELRPRPQAETE